MARSTLASAPALVALAVLATSCRASFPRWDEVADEPASNAAAARLVDVSIAAHGGDPYRHLDEIRAGYEGEWGFIVSKVQPVLVDRGYRQSSTERVELATGRIEQHHTGPEGTKHVIRAPGAIEVRYDGGEPATDVEVVASAALVADAYALFLTGAGFVKQRASDLRLLEPADLDGRAHERVLARLQPGLGLSDEDFVVLWIDRKTQVLRRVHFTMRGLASTRTAHVDVTFGEHREVDGFLFPTRFVERVRAPIPVQAHEWHVTALDVTRSSS